MSLAMLLLCGELLSAQSPIDGVITMGAARYADGRARLTPALPLVRGACWRLDRVQLREGFRTSFRFSITEAGGKDNGSDGFAFVIQNSGPNVIGGLGNQGGFGLGILNSLAVFFDTHRNREDESGNSVSICTSGDKKMMRWPPPRLGVNWRPPMNWKDGADHEAEIAFAPPLMTVVVDGKTVLRAPVDLGRMLGPDGMGYVGFTAATGDGWENHDVWDWRFESTSSAMYSVESTIQFARFECLPGKGLCTPAEAVVTAAGAGKFHVLLPAHLEWGASILNREGAAVRMENVHGSACWDTARGACGVAKVLINNERGRTWLTVEDTNFSDNEGFVEFDVIVEKTMR
jgi:hypothetical protein